jgi:hypothetical protein
VTRSITMMAAAAPQKSQRFRWVMPDDGWSG